MNYEIIKIRNESPQLFNVYNKEGLIAYVSIENGHLICNTFPGSQLIYEDESSPPNISMSKLDAIITSYFENHINAVPYYNSDHTKYAVLVSWGFGTGWSSDNNDLRLAYDSRIIKWYSSLTEQEMYKITCFDTPERQVATDFIHSLGYNIEYINFLGLKPNMIEWVDSDATWRIHEYDGSETIEYLDKKDWVHFNG